MADFNSLKKCGFCGESVPTGAGRCPYCGSILEVTIEDNYQIDPDGYLNNNVSEHGADGQPINGSQTNSDQPKDQTSHYGVSGDIGVSPQESVHQDPQQQGIGSQEPQIQPPLQGPGPQPHMQPYKPIQGNERSPYQNSYQNRPADNRPALSNGLKVFLTILFTVIPGIGQIAGIITAIVFMGSTDQDRKSFGVAILVASLIMFVFACLGCFILSIAASNFPSMY